MRGVDEAGAGEDYGTMSREVGGMGLAEVGSVGDGVAEEPASAS